MQINPARPDVNSRNRSMSPHEELLERSRHVRPPLRLSDDVQATLVQATRHVTVDNDGVIRFQLSSRTYEFYAADSLTCQNQRGKRILASFSYDLMDVLFVFTDDQRFIETIPAKDNVKWFDAAAAGREIRQQQSLLRTAAAELEQLQTDAIQKRLDDGRRNLAKIENWSKAHIVNTFPPETSAQRGGPTVPDDSAEIEDARNCSGALRAPITDDRVGGHRPPLQNISTDRTGTDEPCDPGDATDAPLTKDLTGPRPALSAAFNNARLASARAQQRAAESPRRRRRFLTASGEAVRTAAPGNPANATSGKRGMMAVLTARAQSLQQTTRSDRESE